MAQTMKAIIQDELGGPGVLYEGTIERPIPSVGQVLVAVHAAGVNPADEMNRRTGVFSGTPPFVLGWDVSGAIEAVGPGVTLWQPGDEVVGLLPFPSGGGAYAEFAVAPTRALVRKPASLSHVEAAALPLAGLTAWQALIETALLDAGQRVLVTGASGGVGHLAVQIAVARGAEVIGLASGANVETVRRLGAHRVIDRQTEAFDLVLRDLDVVFETVGGEHPLRAVSTVRDGGIVVSTLPQIVGPAREAGARRGVRVEGLFVESDRLGMQALIDLVETERLRPLIAATHPLADAAAAHADRHGPGKVVLVVR